MLLSAGMQSRVRLGMVTRFLSTSSSSSADNNPKRRALLERIIRVDHAGEFGADRIYAGQMAVLGKTDVGKTIKVRNWLNQPVDISSA